MKTVILDVATRQEAGEDFIRAWETGKPQKNARISFESPELLWKVLTARRWELLKCLCGVGPISIREVARRVGRDVKTVATAAYAQFILAASGFFGIVVLATNGWFVARWVGEAHYLGDTTTVLSVLGMNARHAVNVVAVVLFCVHRDRPLWRVTLCDGVLTLGATAAVVWAAGPNYAPLGSLLVCATFTLPALLSITRAEGSLALPELLRVPALWAAGYAALGVGAAAVARHSTARDPLAQVGLSGGVVLAYVAFLFVVLRRTPLSAYLSGLRRR